MADLSGVLKRFSSKKKCVEFLEKLRWPNGVECPRCGSKKIYRIKSRLKHECRQCHYQFSVTAGTIFHRSHIPLQKWIAATLLMVNAKKGLSAKQLERDLGVTYKTAWYLAHRIRRAMKDTKFLRKMKGIVETDETYVGGKCPGKPPGRGSPNKVICGGALQRGGWVTAKVLENASAGEVCKAVRQNADPAQVSLVCADEWPGYNQLRYEFHLQRVAHGRGEYARGIVHTNGIENFWGLFKRGIVGSFHKVSRKYMQLYLDEFTYRYSWTAKGRPLAGKKVNGAFLDLILSNALMREPAAKG